MRQLLTSEQVAELLQVEPRTIHQWARDGKIPHVRVGKFFRFHEAELEAWIRAEHVASCRSSVHRAEGLPVRPQLLRPLGDLRSDRAS